MIPLLLVLTGAFLASLASTPIVRAMAVRSGAVARPREDRWHRRPTALFGGVGIGASSILVLLADNAWRGAVGVLFIGSGAMFCLGLVDDLRRLRPRTKLLAQLLGALLLVAWDVRLDWTGVYAIDAAATVLWVVGITNAVNLVDNMDGLAAGITAIAAAAMCAVFVHHGQPGPAHVAAALAGSALGFLVYNFKPASIFMGDCGSMFLGYTVAGLALFVERGRALGALSSIAVPVLLLIVPIFDTTFVTLRRTLEGRPVSMGGRDHTSHRLVGLGRSETRAVLALYALGAIGGLSSIIVGFGRHLLGLALMSALLVGVALLGVRLARVRT